MRRPIKGADVPDDGASTPVKPRSKRRRNESDDAKAVGDVQDRTTPATEGGSQIALPTPKRKATSSRKAAIAAKEQGSAAGEDQPQHDLRKRKQRAAGRAASLDDATAGVPAAQHPHPGPVRKQRRAARSQEAAAPQPHEAGGAEAEPGSLPADKAEAARVPNSAEHGGAPPDESDDDAAPEEVTLAAGRSGAAAQRAAEREVRAQQRAAAKERGRRRAALVEAQREARLAAEEEPIVEAAADAEGHGMKTRAEQDEDQDDLLPQEVIAALSRRSREQNASEPRGNELALRQQATGKQQQASKAKLRKPLSQSRQVGPAFVQVLSEIPAPRASESALAFRSSRLQGPGLRRSSEMLVPASSKYFGPAAAFA